MKYFTTLPLGPDPATRDGPAGKGAEAGKGEPAGKGGTAGKGPPGAYLLPPLYKQQGLSNDFEQMLLIAIIVPPGPCCLYDAFRLHNPLF